MAVGGPIWKDKIFFFFAADKFYHDFPAAATITGASANSNFYTAADAALPAGKTCGATGSAAPNYQDANVCQIATNTGLPYASSYTVYNAGIAGLQSTLGTVPRTGDQTIYFPKIDWQVNGKNHVSVEANRMRWTSPAGIQTSPAVAYGLSSFGNDYVRDNWIVGKLDTLFTSAWSNEARYMYGRDFEYETNQAPTPYETSNLIKTPDLHQPVGAADQRISDRLLPDRNPAVPSPWRLSRRTPLADFRHRQLDPRKPQLQVRRRLRPYLRSAFQSV